MSTSAETRPKVRNLSERVGDRRSTRRVSFCATRRTWRSGRTLRCLRSRLRTVWRTGHDADWEAGTYSPPTNMMMYMPLSAISAETGTTAWTHEQRAATYRWRFRPEASCWACHRPPPRPRRRDGRGAGGSEPRVAGQRIPVAHVVDGRQYVLERTGRRQRLALDAMPPELRPSSRQEHSSSSRCLVETASLADFVERRATPGSTSRL